MGDLIDLIRDCAHFRTVDPSPMSTASATIVRRMTAHAVERPWNAVGRSKTARSAQLGHSTLLLPKTADPSLPLANSELPFLSGYKFGCGRIQCVVMLIHSYDV